jgi:hypothetical protein
MNRVSNWASMLAGLVTATGHAPRRNSAGDVAVDSRQHSSSFADSVLREPHGAGTDVPGPVADSASAIGSDHVSGHGAGSGATRHYGPHDPVLDAPKFLWACSCGQRPVLRFKGAPPAAQAPDQDLDQGSAVAAHVVRCPACGRSSKPGFAAWEAITDWNRSNLALDLSLDQFPFFELSGLSLRDARVKLVGIRTDLETRRLQAKQRQREGRDPGRRYRDRIDAYLRWTIVAQALGLAQSRKAGTGSGAGAAAAGSTAADAGSQSAPVADIAAVSASMLVVLRLASEGKSLYADCAGRSEHGARLQTVRALVRRGLLDGRDESLTAAGVATMGALRQRSVDVE